MLLFVLRSAGVVTGPVAVAVALAVVVFLPGSTRVADRVLVALAALFGWIPLLGWVPGLATAVDVPGLLLAGAGGTAVAHQVAIRRRKGPDPGMPRIRPADALAILAATGVSLWWAVPFFRHGFMHRFTLVAAGWDNSSHFHLLGLNVTRGNVTAVRPYAESGQRFFGWEYPQGLHHAWSQWARLWDPTPATDPRSLIDLYVVLVVLTAGFAVLLGCIAVARACEKRPLVAVPGMAVVTQLVAVGILSTSVWVGYPNFAIAVMAVAVAPSLLLRPYVGARSTFFVVSGLLLATAHNWHPMAALGAGAALLAALRLWNDAATRRARVATAAVLTFTAGLAAIPVLPTLTVGSAALLAIGGTPPTSRWFFGVSVFALLAAALLRGVIAGEWSTSVSAAAPAAIGGAAVVALGAYQIASTGALMYYAEKLAAGVAAASAVGLVILVTHVAGAIRLPSVTGSPFVRPASWTAAALSSIAALQLSGYVGPAAQEVAAKDTAEGLRVHEQWRHRDRAAERAAEELLSTAEGARRGGPGTWLYLDLDGGITSADLSDVWFAALVGGFDRPRLPKALALAALNEAENPETAADLVATVYPKITGEGVRLVAPATVADELVRRGHPWTTAGLLWGRLGGDVYSAVPLVPAQQVWLPMPPAGRTTTPPTPRTRR